MKWTYAIGNKFLASVVLLALCLLVLLSNYLDNMHTRHVKNSIATLYEDRLVADDYILKMTGSIYRIREALNSGLGNEAKGKAVDTCMEEFNKWYTVYMKTKLTPAERAAAMELIGSVKIFETHVGSDSRTYLSHTEKALVALRKLSAVQLEESKLIMQNAEEEYASIKASSRFAFAIVIIILAVLQAIVFSAKPMSPANPPGGSRLN